MVRNFLYSLFLHFALIFIAYLNFNFDPPIEIQQTSKVTVSFVVKAGNSDQPSAKEDKPAPIKEEKEVKKELKQKKEEKKPKEQSKKKSEEKQKAKPKKDEAKKKPEKKPEVKNPKKVEPKKEEEKKEEKKPDPEPEIVEIKEEVQSEEIKSDEENQESFSQNTIENLQLLVREKVNIQHQIKHCFEMAKKQSGVQLKEEINVKIFILEDGTVDLDGLIFKDFHKFKDLKEKAYQDSVHLVKETLKFCSPIRNLPEGKYDVWKVIDLKFNE